MIVKSVELATACDPMGMIPQATVTVEIETAGNITVMTVTANIRLIGGGLVETGTLDYVSSAGTLDTYSGTIDLFGVSAEEIIYADVNVDWYTFGTDSGRSAPDETPDCNGPPPHPPRPRPKKATRKKSPKRRKAAGKKKASAKKAAAKKPAAKPEAPPKPAEE